MHYRLSLVLLWLGYVLGQPCRLITPPSASSCGSNCTPFPLDVDVRLEDGRTYCILPNESITVNSIEFEKNVTLIICGSLSVNGDLNLNGSGAQINVSPGGMLQVTNDLNINANAIVTNYGTVNIGGSLQLNGRNSTWWNVASSSTLSVGGDITVNASSRFYNIGSTIQAQSLTLNGNSDLCMRDGGCFSLTDLTVNGNASVQSVGPNAIAYTGHATLNGTLTSSSDLHVCQAPGATVNDPNNWGQAQVTTNCTSGCGVLPAIALSIQTSTTPTGLLVSWECVGCPAEGANYVIRLASGTLELTRRVERTSHLFAGWELPGSEGLVEVRLLGKQGQLIAQGVASWRYQPVQLAFWPNAFREQLWVAYSGEEPIQLRLYDATGAMRWQGLVQPGRQPLPLPDLPPGVYLVAGCSSDGRVIGSYRLLRE